MLKLFDLSGKTALVTGATHGLGMAMAAGLAAAGATIAFNGRSRERIEQALRKYEEQNITAHGYVFDVTDAEQVERHVELIENEVAPIDILVNNAAITKRLPIVDMEVDDFRKIVDVDLTGAFIVSRRVAKNMITRQSGGKVINICSMQSELGRDTISAYASAKGGLKMLTRSMATEWARFNIQANGIGPGYFSTSQTAPLQSVKSFNDFIIRRTPAARWGQPAELQGAVIFLASAASDYVNGHILYVDGGMMATLGRPPED